MWGLADAGGTAMTAATHAAEQTPRNALNTRRLPPERLQPAAQALLEIDLGLPAEHLARTRDVGPAHLRIVRQVVRGRLERDLARRPRDANHRLGELEHRHLVIGAPDVHRQMLTGL